MHCALEARSSVDQSAVVAQRWRRALLWLVLLSCSLYSQSVITKLLPVEHMVHYTHSVFSECVVESQALCTEAAMC